MPDLPEPVKVSPIIKFFRYAFLIAGVFYGATRLKALKIKESFLKEAREQRKVEREAQLAEEKKAANQRDIEQIIAIFTPKPELTVEEQSYKGEGRRRKEESATDVQHEVGGATRELTGISGNTCEGGKSGEQCDIFSNTLNFHESESIKGYPPDDVQADIGATASSDITDFVGDNVNFGDTSEVTNADFGSTAENNTFGESTADNNENFGGENLNESNPDAPKDNGEDVDGYFIQTFPDGIPYLGSEKDTYHYPKSRAE